MRYYEMGAEDEIGDCALVLGTLYRDSADGLSPDKELAYKWIRQAALLGSKNGRMELAKYFENGLGCETNLRKALYWYDLSIIGIWDGNRIRSILRHQKDELSLKLDGFCYETGHFMQEASWWKEYYIKNNMIED